MITLDTNLDGDRLSAIRTWLEDNIGYELGQSPSIIFGDGWQMKFTKFDYSYKISHVDFCFDDPSNASLFALKWL